MRLSGLSEPFRVQRSAQCCWALKVAVPLSANSGKNSACPLCAQWAFPYEGSVSRNQTFERSIGRQPSTPRVGWKAVPRDDGIEQRGCAGFRTFPTLAPYSRFVPQRSLEMRQRMTGRQKAVIRRGFWSRSPPVHANSSSSAFASFRSAVSKPSVNQP